MVFCKLLHKLRSEVLDRFLCLVLGPEMSLCLHTVGVPTGQDTTSRIVLYPFSRLRAVRDPSSELFSAGRPGVGTFRYEFAIFFRSNFSVDFFFKNRRFFLILQGDYCL